MRFTDPLLPQSEAMDQCKESRARFRTSSIAAVAVAAVCGVAVGAASTRGLSSPSNSSVTAPESLAAAASTAYGGSEVCASPSYRQTTMKTAFEQSFFGMVQDQKGEKKFEASDVIKIDEDWYYAIADSSWAIHKFRSDLRAFSAENILIGDPHREEEDSGYEGIFYDKGIFYVVREAVKHHTHGAFRGEYHAIVEELEIDSTGLDYTIKDQCPSEYEFGGDSKGFEGALGLHGPHGEFYMLGLCEGNFCAQGEKGKEKGNGRIVIAQKEVNKDVEAGCMWATRKILEIPPSADFQDYSAISMKPDGTTIITSQENAQAWIGKFKLTGAGGTLDLDDVGFDESEGPGVVYDFPRDTNCEVIYCNVEGIHWVTDTLIVAVSDKMKGKGRQDFRCLPKDQSAHVFTLPK
mmetsp:Transcript_17408/g.40686  ORF Transcript_17408/g.40686 Transcript_17408/m.40686 type:complete len:407 (-) Transcript_17408:59-1279(-)